MPTEMLSMGYPILMVAATTYALPVVPVTLYCDTVSTFSQSATVGFTVTTGLTVTAGLASPVAGAFIRCSTTTNIVLKRLS